MVANQILVQGTRDSEAMTVESCYLKDFQRYKLSFFDDSKVDPITAET